MIDLYLRADTETNMIAALPWAYAEASEHGPAHWLSGGDGWALDVIGPVAITPGEYDENGAETVPPVIDGRWHTNLRLVSLHAVPDVPASVIINPEPGKPVRGWA